MQNKQLLGQEVRVNWAFQAHEREDTSEHHHVFVGDLGQDVTDAVLFAAFAALPGCSDARVMWDHATGRSKGEGRRGVPPTGPDGPTAVLGPAGAARTRFLLP